MASSARFKIEGVSPDIYIDDRGTLVNGFTVRFSIPSFNELHSIRVPKMDKDLIEGLINEFVDQREALDGIG